jgi:hypothetical protein
MADLKKWALVLAVFGAGCGSKIPYLVHASNGKPVTTPQTLAGTFERIDQTTEDLSLSTDKPTVVIFSQDTCEACSEETDTLLSKLAHKTENPTRAHIYTVLVGAIIEDAVAWKQLHPVPWEVGIDTKSVLFGQYCSVHTVPCVVVYVPGKGIVLTENGEASFDTLTSLTGPWEE